MDAKKHNPTVNKLDELFHDVREYRNSEKFKMYMDFCAHFRMLGAYNATLVCTQRRGVRYALTSRQWRKYNMRPKANACPLVILMPFYPVDFVFDISDVEHIPGTPELKYQDELDKMAKPFKAEGRVITEEVLTLQSNLKLLGIMYDPGLFAGSTLGGMISCDYGTEIETIPRRGKDCGFRFPHYYRISINAHNDDAEEFATLCHELGHYFCRHLPPPTPDWWEQRKVTKEQEEFEAESVAWLVCQRHGIDCIRTTEYLAGYLDKCEKVPEVAMGTIMSAVDQIERLFERMNLSESPLYKYDDDFYYHVTGKRRIRSPKIR